MTGSNKLCIIQLVLQILTKQIIEFMKVINNQADKTFNASNFAHTKKYKIAHQFNFKYN